MISAFAIFRLVKYDRTFHLKLTNVQVALEVGRIIMRLPQAKLYTRESRNIPLAVRLVFDGQVPNFKRFPRWDKIANIRPDTLIG